jgi:hypothetical protein
VKTIAKITIKAGLRTFEDFMLVEVALRDGCWEALEHCNNGEPMVYDTMKEAQEAFAALYPGEDHGL